MDKKFQKDLLEELYSRYLNSLEGQINRPFRVAQDLPDKERDRNIAYLKEKGFIEEDPSGSMNLKIKMEGIKYLGQLKVELDG